MSSSPPRAANWPRSSTWSTRYVAGRDEVAHALVEVEQVADAQRERVRAQLRVGHLLAQRDGRDDDDRPVGPWRERPRRAARRAPRRAGRRGAAAASGATRTRRRGWGRSARAAGAATRAGRRRGRAPGDRRRRRRASGATGPRRRAPPGCTAAATRTRTRGRRHGRGPPPPASSVKWLRRGRRVIVQAKRPRMGAAGALSLGAGGQTLAAATTTASLSPVQRYSQQFRQTIAEPGAAPLVKVSSM